MHFPSTKIITPFIYHDVSISKILYAKEKDMGYANKNPCERAQKMDTKCPNNKTMVT
jgi:hypothetical protein